MKSASTLQLPANALGSFNLNLGGLSGISLAPQGAAKIEPQLATNFKPQRQSLPLDILPSRCPVYLDIETIPDESRRHLFGLDAPVEKKPEVDPIIGNYVDFMKKPIAQIKEIVCSCNPTETWLNAFETWERNSETKCRQGILDLVKSIREARNPGGPEAEAAKIKKMSVTPEFLKIISIGIAVGDDDPQGFVVDDHVGGNVTEADLLEWAWKSIKDATSLYGFNVLGFDLPAILVRSSILKVKPYRAFSTKPWESDVVDLMLKRWPKGNQMGLKDTARLMGIDIPAGDMDGSKVYETFQRDPYEIPQYVKSDVVITRELKRMWTGFFC